MSKAEKGLLGNGRRKKINKEARGEGKRKIAKSYRSNTADRDRG